MIPRIGCTISLESNYNARFIHVAPAPPRWDGLGIICINLHRLIGIYIYAYMYVSMYKCMRSNIYIMKLYIFHQPPKNK